MRPANQFLVTVGAITLLLVASIFAATAPVEAEITSACVVWQTAGQWTLYRCEDEQTGEMCIHSSSGMMQCRLD